MAKTINLIYIIQPFIFKHLFIYLFFIGIFYILFKQKKYKRVSLASHQFSQFYHNFVMC